MASRCSGNTATVRVPARKRIAGTTYLDSAGLLFVARTGSGELRSMTPGKCSAEAAKDAMRGGTVSSKPKENEEEEDVAMMPYEKTTDSYRSRKMQKRQSVRVRTDTDR